VVLVDIAVHAARGLRLHRGGFRFARLAFFHSGAHRLVTVIIVVLVIGGLAIASNRRGPGN
jgi:hypothetical protein